MIAFAAPLSLVLLTVGSPATSDASLAAGRDGDFVFELDPDTHAPLGEKVEADGLLLDPRDLPEQILPFLEAARGLESLELSLTALYGRSIGFASKGKKLAKRYSAFSKNQAAMWKELVDEQLARIDWEEPGTLLASAMHHDTGRRIGADQLTVVGPPRIALLPIEAEELKTLLEIQADVAQFSPEMSAEAAERLLPVYEAYEDDHSDPWFGHAMVRLFMLKIGNLSEEMLENPFEMTGEEFMARIRLALHAALVIPLFPALPEDVVGEDVWFLEGLAFVQGVHRGEDWPEVPELEAHNELVHQPILLIQVQGRKAGQKVKSTKRVRIAMVVDGETRTLHDGKWPLR